MRKILIPIILALLTTISIKANVDSDKIVAAHGYIFKVGEQWLRAGTSDEGQIRNMMRKSMQGFAEFNNNFFVFNTPKGYMVMIYDVVYTGTRPSMAERLERSNQKFRMGVDRGIVKTILTNNIRTVLSILIS